MPKPQSGNGKGFEEWLSRQPMNEGRKALEFLLGYLTGFSRDGNALATQHILLIRRKPRQHLGIAR